MCKDTTRYTLQKLILCCLTILANVCTPTYLMQKILHPDETGTDYFGESVGITNKYCVIGASRDDSSSYIDGGAAYIYKYYSIENEWNHTQTLYPNGIENYAYCGGDVSIFENYIIIGCYGTLNKAYVYKLNETNETWYQLSTLAATASDQFGYSVDITDGYAIVGDYENDDEATDAGSSYIFVQTFDQNNQESWIYSQTLYANDSARNDYFGYDVSISYHYAIIGSPRNDDKGGNSGSAYIFEVNLTTMVWEQSIKLLASDGTNSDWFGKSVAIDSIYGLAIVGAYQANDNIGASYIYYKGNNTNNSHIIWNETAVIWNPNRVENNDTTDQKFGFSVSIRGETCIVGATDTNSGTGEAYQFKLRWDTTTTTRAWQKTSHFIAFDGESNDNFGWSVDVSTDFAVITARTADAAYIYAGIGPSLHPTASPTALPTATPTSAPTTSPSSAPTLSPTIAPTPAPTMAPTASPTIPPTSFPTTSPSSVPTISPIAAPTSSPSVPPSSAPSVQPSLAPSISPTLAPSDAPSSAPTNTYCDRGVQTRDTFIVCKFLLSVNENNLIFDLFSSPPPPDYCNITDTEHDNEYFKCSDTNSSITHMFLSNCNIDGSLNSNATSYLHQVISNGSLVWLDLSDNEISGEVIDWSVFSRLQYLSLAKNRLEGVVDFEQLSSQNTSLAYVDLSSNNFKREQPISWKFFEFMLELEHFDISNNTFTGNIELSYFQHCTNLKYFNVAFNYFAAFDDFDESITDTYMPQLEEFIVNDNEIYEPFDMNFFSSSNKIKTIKCNNNLLINSKLDMSDIPSNLETFICGNNDFGEFIWDSSPYDDYKLEYIDLTNARIHGHITMKFFDYADGGYKELKYVDLSSNKNLNFSINFIHLDGQANLYYLNLSTTDSYGYVDFDYLANDNVTIILDDNIYCVDSFCSGNNNGKNYGYIRSNSACYSKDNCLETCKCDTAYTLGLEKFIASQGRQISFVVLIVSVCVLSVIVVLGKLHAMGMDSKLGISIGIQSDYFEFVAFFGFIFQIWDFFSDLLLCFDIFDHYNQASINNPEKGDYFRYLILCAVFIFLPWMVNLMFLIRTKRGWENESAAHHVSSKKTSARTHGAQKIDALTQSSLATSKWLNKYSKILVAFCMVSGGLTASLKVANSNLFGLKQFNMKLPKYKQDENARHRLWLTIVLENVPQIFISTSYATNLAGFDTTVLVALISSIASVVLALLSAYLEYPKNYYIYQMGLELKSTRNPQLRKRLRMRNTLSKVICESMDREKGFLFVENTYYNGKDFVCFNVVSNQPLTTFDFRKKRKMIKLLFENSKLRITCDKVLFTFVDFQCVELSLQLICNKSSRSKNNNKDDNELRKDNVELAMVAGMPQKHLQSASTTFSMNDMHDLAFDETIGSGLTMAGMSEIGASTPDINFTRTSTVESSRRGSVDEESRFNLVNKVDWHLWTAKQVNAWVEMELRRGSANLGISDIIGENTDGKKISIRNQDSNDIEFVDEQQEMLAETFLKKFESLSLSGQLLLEMKKNDQLMQKFETMMSDSSLGFWFILSNAINSLELPNDNNNDINSGVVDGMDAHVDEETAKLLSEG